eukprot:7709279-Lingulodinium_polyedra.AAC.1
MYRKRNLIIVSIHSVLTTRATVGTNLLVFTLDTGYEIPGITLDECLEVLVWSMNAAYSGVHPRTDHRGRQWDGGARSRLAGSPIAGGWKMAIVQDEADWKFHLEKYHWKGYRHNTCCHICPASKVGGAMIAHHFARVD